MSERYSTMDENKISSTEKIEQLLKDGNIRGTLEGNTKNALSLQIIFPFFVGESPWPL